MANLAYSTVKASNAFAIFGVARTTEGRSTCPSCSAGTHNEQNAYYVCRP